MKLEDRPTPEADKHYGVVKKRQVRGFRRDLEHARRLEQQRDAWRDVAAELAEALIAVVTMQETAKPRKLEEALSWKENDELATKMKETALRLYAEAKKEMSE